MTDRLDAFNIASCISFAQRIAGRPLCHLLPLSWQCSGSKQKCASANHANGDVWHQGIELERVPVKFAVPPVALQREFARRVTAVETLKTAQRASLAELDALFATLQHRAFNGELFREKDRKSLVA